MLKRLLGQRHLQIVGQTLHRRGIDAARGAYGLRDGLPHRVDELLHLTAVGVGHLREDVGLHGALVGADRRAEDLGLQVELVEQPLVEHQIEGEAGPVEPPFGLDVDRIGHRGEVVAPLRIGLGVGDDELAARAELVDRRTDLLQLRRTDGAAPHAEPQVDALNAVVRRGGIERPQDVEHRELLRHTEGQRIEPAQRIGRRGVDDRLRKIDLQDRLVRHDRRALHRSRDAEKQHDPQKKDRERAHHEGEQTGQKHFDEVHDSYRIDFVIRRKGRTCARHPDL